LKTEDTALKQHKQKNVLSIITCTLLFNPQKRNWTTISHPSYYIKRGKKIQFLFKTFISSHIPWY